jgi:hypothetical protein
MVGFVPAAYLHVIGDAAPQIPKVEYNSKNEVSIRFYIHSSALTFLMFSE